jgi:peptidoglycan/xylan/chitin deacetylase (PgdA/CDA1 family)
VPDARLASEMRDSRARLEQELGHPVECIAYPFGSYDGRVVKAAADAGYRLAVIADGPSATDASPALELPRWKMAYGEPLPLFVQRLRAP